MSIPVNIIFIIVVGAMLGLLAEFGYRAYRREQSAANNYKERFQTATNENTYLRERLSEIIRVLNTNEGGISKRLSESIEITEAICQGTPDAFKKEFGLAYWLHANDQFLVKLASVSNDLLDQLVSDGIERNLAKDRDNLFAQAYAAAGVQDPLPLKNW